MSELCSKQTIANINPVDDEQLISVDNQVY